METDAEVEPTGLAESVLIRSRVPTTQTLFLDPSRFYEFDYAPTLSALIGSIIAAERVIVVRRLARLVARRHGFQRTGHEIVRIVREKAALLGQKTASSDDEDIIWEFSTTPARHMPFRGLSISNERRDWAETPYPEKLGLALSVLTQADPVRSMADALTLGRLTTSMREEFDKLLYAARMELQNLEARAL